MNPNKYDNDAFLEASNEFQGNVTEMLNKLWAAGADDMDITTEINTALENSDVMNSRGISLHLIEGVDY